MNREEKQIIRKTIESYEWNRGWYRKINGAFIQAKNLRIKKDNYACDIHYHNDMNKTKEVFYDIIYPKEIIDKIIKGDK